MDYINSATATIRQRGQLTIPDKIRHKLMWIQPESVVSIRRVSNDKVLIEPLRNTHALDWKKLRAQLRRVSQYQGKRGNLSQFVLRDREKH